MLVIAHPLDAHRATGYRAREQRRIKRHVIGAVMAVAARPLRMDAADGRFVHLQHLGEILAQRKDALGVRPYRQLAVIELRHRAGWADRAMHDVRLGVGRLQRARSGRGTSLLLTYDHVLCGHRHEMRGKPALVRQLAAAAPDCAAG